MEEKKFFVYKTTNLLNGKIYIGQHNGNKEKYMGSGTYIQRAFRKHGRENFKREILCYCKTKEQVDKKEIYYIKKLGTTDPKVGYNFMDVSFSADAAGSFAKMRTSKDYRGNHKEAIRKFRETPKAREVEKRHGEIMVKKFKNKEYRKAQSDRIKKYLKEHPEALRKRSKNLKEFFKTERGAIQLKKAHEATKEKWKTKEFREKRRNTLQRYYDSNKFQEDVKKRANGLKRAYAEGRFKKTKIGLKKYSLEGKLLNVYSSYKEAAEENNINIATLGNSRRHKNGFACGFIWKRIINK